MFNFRRLIDKYKKEPPYLKVVEEGFHDYDNGGEWVDGPVSYLEIDGACLPLKKEVILSDARLTHKDRRIYSYTLLKENDKIEFNNEVYTLMELTDYSMYDDGLYSGLLKAGGVND